MRQRVRKIMLLKSNNEGLDGSVWSKIAVQCDFKSIGEGGIGSRQLKFRDTRQNKRHIGQGEGLLLFKGQSEEWARRR